MFKPPFQLQITNGPSKRLGNCYHSYVEIVKSRTELTQDRIKALRAAHFIGGGQEFRLLEQHQEFISTPELDDKTQEPTNSGKTAPYEIWVYTFETRVDSSD